MKETPVQPQGLKRRHLIAGAGAAWLAPAQAADRRAEVLRVGPGQDYASITAAGERLVKKWDPSAGAPGPIHMIISPGPPGYYANDFDSYSRRWPNGNHGGWPPYHGILMGPALIEGEPGKPAPDLECVGGADGVIYYQKGAWITGEYDATFRHLNFSGFRRADGQGNYAAIRIEPKPSGNFLFEDIGITACDNGLLGGSPGQKVTLRRCNFTANGNSTGLAHNIYIGPVDLLTVEDVLSTRSVIGHLLKTRAAKTLIRRTRLLTGDATSSACLDVPDAGVLEIDDLVCEKGENSDASWLIHYAGENQDSAGEPFHNPSSVTIRNLTMIAPPRLASHPGWRVVGFANHSGDGPDASGAGSHLIVPQASGVKIYGLSQAMAGLPDAEILSEMPRLDWTSPIRS